MSNQATGSSPFREAAKSPEEPEPVYCTDCQHHIILGGKNSGTVQDECMVYRTANGIALATHLVAKQAMDNPRKCVAVRKEVGPHCPKFQQKAVIPPPSRWKRFIKLCARWYVPVTILLITLSGAVTFFILRAMR